MLLAHSPVKVSIQPMLTTESAQTWWESITQDCDIFFEIMARFRVDLPASQIAVLLMEMEMARERVRSSLHPRFVSPARHSLLDAMNSVRSGFAAALGGDPETASHYIRQAQQFLCQFGTQLDQLGVA